MNRISIVVILMSLIAVASPAAQRNIRGQTRTSVNNTNINRNTNINVNRDIDVNVNVNHAYGYGCCYHPVATAAAVTAAAVVTAAVVGSMVHTLPPACVPIMVGTITYQQCGS